MCNNKGDLLKGLFGIRDRKQSPLSNLPNILGKIARYLSAFDYFMSLSDDEEDLVLSIKGDKEE
jgi:hypothetical protein